MEIRELALLLRALLLEEIGPCYENFYEKYLEELLNNIFSSETREGFGNRGSIGERDDIEGLILGGIELPLILRGEEHNGVPFPDTTKIHVERIIAELLS